VRLGGFTQGRRKNMRILLNLIVWPCMALGLLYAYARMGFSAGLLCAADMMKQDVKTS